MFTTPMYDNFPQNIFTAKEEAFISRAFNNAQTATTANNKDNCNAPTAFRRFQEYKAASAFTNPAHDIIKTSMDMFCKFTSIPQNKYQKSLGQKINSWFGQNLDRK